MSFPLNYLFAGQIESLKNQVLCDYLKKMDEEEFAKTKEEEQQLKELAGRAHNIINYLLGASFLGGMVSMLVGPTVANSSESKGKWLLYSAAESFIAGAAFALRLDIQLAPYRQLEKNVTLDRLSRLSEKIRLISERILELEKDKDRNLNEINQLNFVKTQLNLRNTLLLSGMTNKITIEHRR